MTLHTKNSVYTLADMGDGAFLMTSTNKKYSGPNTVRLIYPPSVGNSAYMTYLDGERKGRTLITTPIDHIVWI